MRRFNRSKRILANKRFSKRPNRLIESFEINSSGMDAILAGIYDQTKEKSDKIRDLFVGDVFVLEMMSGTFYTIFRGQFGTDIGTSKVGEFLFNNEDILTIYGYSNDSNEAYIIKPYSSDRQKIEFNRFKYVFDRSTLVKTNL